MKTWICGNSHVGALRRGYAQLVDPPPLHFFPFGNGVHETSDFSALVGGKVLLTQEVFARNLHRATGRDHLSAGERWGLVLGTHTARVYRHPVWATEEPGDVAAPGARPLTQGQVDAILVDDQVHTRRFFERLREAGVPFFVIGAPPPRGDHPSITKGVRAATVKALDRRARELLAAWLEERGVTFVDYPPDTAIDGLLDPALAAGPRPDGAPDPHHGSADYGQRMLEHILARVPGLRG